MPSNQAGRRSPKTDNRTLLQGTTFRDAEPESQKLSLRNALILKISTIGLFGKFRDASVAPVMDRVRSLLEARNIRVLLGNTTSTEIDGERIDDQEFALGQVIDIAMVVGGDGTMLNAARTLCTHNVPMVGVNLGRLGFLTDIPQGDLESNLEALLQGRFSLEQRTLLKSMVLQNDVVIHEGISLNDSVISKGNTGRLIEFETRIDGRFVSHTRSDGIIVATPTGSTAYSLSAGGPIMYPTLSVMSIAPICPHTLSNRPIIISDESVVEIIAINTPETRAHLSLDGLVVHEISGDETIRLTKADTQFSIIRIDSHNHFEVLRTKLGWG